MSVTLKIGDITKSSNKCNGYFEYAQVTDIAVVDGEPLYTLESENQRVIKCRRDELLKIKNDPACHWRAGDYIEFLSVPNIPKLNGKMGLVDRIDRDSVPWKLKVSTGDEFYNGSPVGCITNLTISHDSLIKKICYDPAGIAVGDLVKAEDITSTVVAVNREQCPWLITTAAQQTLKSDQFEVIVRMHDCTDFRIGSYASTSPRTGIDYTGCIREIDTSVMPPMVTLRCQLKTERKTIEIPLTDLVSPRTIPDYEQFWRDKMIDGVVRPTFDFMVGDFVAADNEEDEEKRIEGVVCAIRANTYCVTTPRKSKWYTPDQLKKKPYSGFFSAEFEHCFAHPFATSLRLYDEVQTRLYIPDEDSGTIVAIIYHRGRTIVGLSNDPNDKTKVHTWRRMIDLELKENV